MAIPMKQRAVATASVFKELSDKTTVIDMLYEFARGFVPSQEITAVRKFVNSTSSETPAEAIASSAQSLMPSISSFCLFATYKSERLTALMNMNALLNSSVFNYICSSMRTAQAQMDMPAAVLFKVKHLGIYVAYNGSFVRNEGPRIILPATAKGVDEIKILELNQFKHNMKEVING